MRSKCASPKGEAKENTPPGMGWLDKGCKRIFYSLYLCSDEIDGSVSEALLRGVARCRDIHLEGQHAPEGLLEGVSSKGEFHGEVVGKDGC